MVQNLPEHPIRIIIADDQPHFRHGLKVALEEAGSHIEVVGEASTGEEAIDLCESLAPDLAILDVRMPGIGGIGSVPAISTLACHAKVLMLTVSDEADDVAQAMRAGAAGYLLKERSLEEIADAVVAVAAGHSWPAAAS